MIVRLLLTGTATAAAALVAAAAALSPATGPDSSAPVAFATAATSSCAWRDAAQRLARALDTSGVGSPDERVAAIREALAAAGVSAASSPPASCSSPAPTPVLGSSNGPAGGVSAGSGSPADDAGTGAGPTNPAPGSPPAADALSLVTGSGGSPKVSSSAQLQQAVAAARPGDTIQLAAGTYNPLAIAGVSGTAQAPITLTGPADAVIDGGAISGGYAVHLDGASFWQLSGFSVTGGGKGVVVDGGGHNVLDSLDVGRTGDEAVHFRANSSDNSLQRSTIHDTGLAQPQYGEGAYIGSAKSNWKKISGGQPDLSMRNRIVDNTFQKITAENVDVKEETSGALISGNRFDGSATSGKNYADSIVDIKGYGSTVRGNVTTGTSPALRNIIETHVITDPATSGCGNTITDNTVQGFQPTGVLVAVDKKCGETTPATGTTTASGSGASAGTNDSQGQG